jgi:hypothetical protein
MIVIYRDGQRTVITGWRAWLIVGAAVSLAALVVVAALGLLLGIALTIGTILLFAVPLAFVLAVIMRAVLPKQ